jgi:hypothetical protein
MGEVFDFSSLGHGLAVFGVFMLNFFIYEFVCFGIYMTVVLGVLKYSNDEARNDRIMTVGMMFSLTAFLLLIILYAGGLFRLIPLP